MAVAIAFVLRRMLVAGALASAAGCMFFRSLDDLTSEPPEAGALREAGGEAASQPMDDGASDGDAPAVEGGPNPIDAGGFCDRVSTKPLLCDDFADGSLSNWGSNDAGGAVVPEPGTGDTEPGSAAISLGPLAGSCEYANLARRFEGSYRRARLSLSLWIDPAHAFAARPIANLIIGSYGSGNSLCQLVLYAGSGAVSVLDQRVDGTGVTGEVSHPGGEGVAAGTWARFVLEQNFAAQTISLQVNGTSRVTAVPTPCAIEPDAVMVDVGFVCAAAPANQRVLVDDVLVEGD